MKLGPILRSPVVLDDTRRATVAAECAAFLRAGGTLTLADWDSLSNEGRECMIAAAEAVERSRARVAQDEGMAATAEALGRLRERRAAVEALDAGEAEAARL